MSAIVTTAAALARAEVADRLESEGIPAALNAGAFYPQPVAALIGMPTLTGRGLASSSFEIPVTVVSGDPLTTEDALDRLYSMADAVADCLNEAAYRPGSWQGGPNQEPLPSIEVLAHVRIAYPGG